MALVTCPNCGTLVSNKGKECPVCGMPVPKILAILNGEDYEEPVIDHPQPEVPEPPAQEVKADVTELPAPVVETAAPAPPVEPEPVIQAAGPVAEEPAANPTDESSPQETTPESGKSRRSLLTVNYILLGATLLFFLLFVITQVKKSMVERNLRATNYELYSTQSTLSEVRERVAVNHPILIDRIEMGNRYKDGRIYDDYGTSIYSRNTMFLSPKIYYYGVASRDVTLYVKLYNAYGSLSQGRSSPSGYSYSYKCSVSEGDNYEILSSWGSEYKGHWTSGRYKIEIWYNGVCLKSHSFRIY